MRIHMTLKVSPAMAAGIPDMLLSMDDLFIAMDAAIEPKKRGPYKKAVREISN